MKISLHEIEYEINVFIILCTDKVLQSDNVGVSVQFSKKNNLSKGSLGIGCILKGIKNLFDGNNIFCLFIDGLPDNSIGSLSQLLKYLKFVEDMWLNFFRHCSL